MRRKIVVLIAITIIFAVVAIESYVDAYQQTQPQVKNGISYDPDLTAFQRLNLIRIYIGLGWIVLGCTWLGLISLYSWNKKR